MCECVRACVWVWRRGEIMNLSIDMSSPVSDRHLFWLTVCHESNRSDLLVLCLLHRSL